MVVVLVAVLVGGEGGLVPETRVGVCHMRTRRMEGRAGRVKEARKGGKWDTVQARRSKQKETLKCKVYHQLNI